jgi:hypothetical protein
MNCERVEIDSFRFKCETKKLRELPRLYLYMYHMKKKVKMGRMTESRALENWLCGFCLSFCVRFTPPKWQWAAHGYSS